MIFDGELAVKLHAKDVDVGNSADGNHMDLLTTGMCSIDLLISSKALATSTTEMRSVDPFVSTTDKLH